MQLNITNNIILKLIYFNLQKFSFKENLNKIYHNICQTTWKIIEIEI